MRIVLDNGTSLTIQPKEALRLMLQMLPELKKAFSSNGPFANPLSSAYEHVVYLYERVPDDESLVDIRVTKATVAQGLFDAKDYKSLSTNDKRITGKVWGFMARNTSPFVPMCALCGERLDSNLHDQKHQKVDNAYFSARDMLTKRCDFSENSYQTIGPKMRGYITAFFDYLAVELEKS